jgi:hypothetical protein
MWRMNSEQTFSGAGFQNGCRCNLIIINTFIMFFVKVTAYGKGGVVPFLLSRVSTLTLLGGFLVNLVLQSALIVEPI